MSNGVFITEERLLELESLEKRYIKLLEDRDRLDNNFIEYINRLRNFQEAIKWMNLSVWQFIKLRKQLRNE